MSALPASTRRVAVIGLGRSGTAAARLLASAGREVVALDRAPGAFEDLAAEGIEVRTGSDAPVEDVDLVVKSPGVPGEVPAVAAARASGIPIWSEVELATRVAGNPVLAITGTNGKTTTTELTAHLLARAGIAAQACGNLGTPVSALVRELSPEVWLVVECSSFQLEDVERFHPRGAALLNIAPDHLDRHGTFERYRAAKLRIFERLGRDDLAIAPAGMSATTLGASLRTVGDPGPNAAAWSDGGELHVADLGPVCSWSGLPLRGRHNRENMMAAAALAAHAGAAASAIAAGLADFPGVPHRLEVLAERGGVLYVNDSKATNPDAAIAALDAYPEGVHLIAGGRGKGTTFDALASAARTAVRAVYLIGESADQLRVAFDGHGVEVHDCGDLATAVGAARSRARRGEVVLLAPACASFDQFASFEARGDAFRALVAA